MPEDGPYNLPEDDVPQGTCFLKLREPVENALIFHVGNREVLKFTADGDIHVRGKVVENDIEVVHALRKFIAGVGLAPSHWEPEHYGESPHPSRFERLDDE